MKPLGRLSLLLLLAGGCATTRLQSLTAGAIIAMTQAGVTDPEIIRRIGESRTVFHLDTTEVARLRIAGVSDRVVKELLDTDQRFSAAEQRRADIADEEWQQRFGPWPRGPGNR